MCVCGKGSNVGQRDDVLSILGRSTKKTKNNNKKKTTKTHKTNNKQNDERGRGGVFGKATEGIPHGFRLVG